MKLNCWNSYSITKSTGQNQTLSRLFTPSKTACSCSFLSTPTYHFPAKLRPVNLPQPTTFRHPFRLREEQVALGKLVTGWQLILSDLLKYQMPIKCVCHHFFVPVSGIFYGCSGYMSIFKVQGVQVVFFIAPLALVAPQVVHVCCINLMCGILTGCIHW